MVRDLILASARDLGDIQHIRFPGGESGQVRGYDGDLSSAIGTPYIPVGRSVWEFGTNEKAVDKFKLDYNARVADTDKDCRKDLTFIFVTPRNWDNPNLKLPEFANEYKSKEDFADVRYIDGAMLETWLEEHGAVGAKHARLVLGTAPNRGARSTDEFWQEFSTRYSPQLTEDVALAARASQAVQIVNHLMSSSGPLLLVGDGPEEVSAVAVAAIRKADQTKRQFLEARTLIVDTDDAGRLLSRAGRYSYILSPTVKQVGESLASYGPTVSTLEHRPSNSAFAHLERPSVRDMTDALMSMGFVEEEAEVLARKSGRSLTILHRHAPRAGFSPPSWVEGGNRLVPALLAGAWNTQNPGDCEIVAELCGTAYDDYEQHLRIYLRQHDTPIDVLGGIWRLRAPVDVFVNLSHLVTRKHLQSLAKVAIKVLTTDTPPDYAEERFGKSGAPYGSFLRDGIATTLLIIAAMHEEVGLDVGLDPEAFVNELVASLPGLHNDIRVIFGLDRQLTYLMEAAPRPLLSALELLLKGDETTPVLFAETDSFFGATRSHLPNLLWALELQAWDPAYFRRVALLLAKLASRDLGGKGGNRPISSLRSILLAWSPGTNASHEERLAVIDEIVDLHQPVGWQLITMLLPKQLDTKSLTQRPRYRDAGASERETLTRGIVDETYDAVVDRALSMVGEDPLRWIDVAEAFPRFSPDRRAQFLDMLAPYADRCAAERRVELRGALRRLADRHARFRQADWVLPDQDLERLQGIVRSLESVDPFEQARALFDEWNPYFTGDLAAAERALEQRRANAVANLAATLGAAGVIRLAGSVRSVRGVAGAAAAGVVDEATLRIILIDGAPDAPAPELTTALAGALRRSRGETYDAEILALARQFDWSNVRTSSLLLEWPEDRQTWRLVGTLGADAERYFWANRRPFRFEGSVEEMEELVHHFLAAGRPGNALSVVHPREKELSWPTIVAILAARVGEINEDGTNGYFDDYLVGELFKSLRCRDDVYQLEIARWEYVYFPVLKYKNADLTLYERMASDPEFYVSILKDVYVADDVEVDDQASTPEQRNRASISHRILIHNTRVPGEKDGTVHQEQLDAWIDGMLEEGRKQKRAEVVRSYIGRTLAHAVEVDGIWPPPTVAAAIERLRSEEVERSIIIERYNMRGVVRKSMFEGGGQERELATQYCRWAAENVGFPRTKAVLAAAAEGWAKDAKSADDEAERDRIRFE